ncbi:hypothetical protein BDV96DRAFT_591724 [Lophiotrema nucula]|uniref:Ser-Thr-rich glycosyl-phosphatidyl-inositol-anchored membrane family-domain-containing protein n=1 Tax=Lophiotrema nucula TaxID=690887 RepID=A0A6A5YG56_9PLEO|nr:hypothetical protein BDV96DRAFT_591724 [Lophiotrema nucula]
MLVRSLFLAALTAPAAYADFLVLTKPPIPTSAIPRFSDSVAATSWTVSVFFKFNNAWESYTEGLNPGYDSTASEILASVSSFVATAPANYSIPAEVTDPSKTTTISTAATPPPWYTALPSNVRSYKEAEVTQMQSVLASIVGIDSTGGIATSATRTSGLATKPTGAAGLGAALGVAAGAAAVFL